MTKEQGVWFLLKDLKEMECGTREVEGLVGAVIGLHEDMEERIEGLAYEIETVVQM